MTRTNEMEISFEQLDAVDFVHVVRCSVCRKRWHDGYCSVNKRFVRRDDYCSLAEKEYSDETKG